MKIHDVKTRYPTLATLGFAAERFPRFVSLEPFPHGVDVVLCTVILRGRALHVMDDASYPEDGFSLGVTHYGQRHCLVTGPEGIEVINLYLNLEDRNPLPDLPSPVGEILPCLLPLSPRFRHRLNRIARLSFDRRQPAETYIRQLHRELKGQEPGFETAARDLLRLFLLECCRHALARGIRGSGGDGDSEMFQRLENVRRHLDRRHRGRFTLSDLAAKFAFSPGHLCKLFKRHTGRSVFTYLLERRLQATMLELRGNDKKISQIAMENGFRDLSFFNRKFRQAVGTSPGNYRNSALALEKD